MLQQINLETVLSFGYVPRIVRGDKGTENAKLCSAQRRLRSSHGDSFSGYASFQYGRSTAIQRIEAWWSFLKRDTTSFWINYFKDLVDLGLYDSSNVFHTEALLFSFGWLIQERLDETVKYWNHHRIRKSKNSDSPYGSPDIMYLLPGIYGGSKRQLQFLNTDINYCKRVLQPKKPSDFYCSDNFAELAAILMNQNNMRFPSNLAEAENIYSQLISLLANV